MAEKWTNTSSPVERWMKPYPLAPLNHFTVPFSLTKNSFQLYCDLTSASFVELMLRTTPSKKTEGTTGSYPRNSRQQKSPSAWVVVKPRHKLLERSLWNELDCRTQTVNPKQQATTLFRKQGQRSRI